MKMMKLWKNPVLKGSLLLCLLIALIHLISALTVDKIIAHTEVQFASPKITDALDGYRIVFLTDIHGTPEQDLREMVKEINTRGVDLVLLGGDFSGQKDLWNCLAILAGIQAVDGFYGVEGNHDNADRLRTAMQDNGMVLLENEGLRVKDSLYVAGLEDLWNRSPNVQAALAGAVDTDFILMLAHNPDTTMAHDFTRVDLTLSGHVHGGEVTFFGLWAPAMPMVSEYGQRFTSGWCQSAVGTDVYVSRGIGAHALRVFARPQVVYVTLQAEHE